METNIKGGNFHFKGERKRRKKNKEGDEERKKEKKKKGMDSLYLGLSGPSHLKGSS